MVEYRLLEHTIAAIETRTIQIRYPRLVGLNARRGIHGTGPTAQIRVVTTDRGACGWGLSRASEDQVPHLVGRCLGELFHQNRGVIAPEAIGTKNMS